MTSPDLRGVYSPADYCLIILLQAYFFPLCSLHSLFYVLIPLLSTLYLLNILLFQFIVLSLSLFRLPAYDGYSTLVHQDM
jgi:hypothetical protein